MAKEFIFGLQVIVTKASFTKDASMGKENGLPSLDKCMKAYTNLTKNVAVENIHGETAAFMKDNFIMTKSKMFNYLEMETGY